jgi:hypothetical protein
MDKKLEVGQVEKRQGYVELPLSFVDKINDHVSQENGFIRGMKVFAFVGTMLIALLCWVFVQKNDDIKTMNGDIKNMQTILNAHSIQINETLTILKNEMDVNRRQQDRIEKNTEKIWGINKK